MITGGKMIGIESTGSPVMSEVFALIALGVISVVVLLMLRYYLPLRTTPSFYVVPIFFSIWLPAGIVLLVPIDLASSATIEDEAARGIWLPSQVLLISWRVTYWLTFALTWFVSLWFFLSGLLAMNSFKKRRVIDVL